MKTDTLFDPYADRTNFVTSHPHTRVIGIALRRDTKMLNCENHRLKQTIDVTLGGQAQLL